MQKMQQKISKTSQCNHNRDNAVTLVKFAKVYRPSNIKCNNYPPVPAEKLGRSYCVRRGTQHISSSEHQHWNGSAEGNLVLVSNKSACRKALYTLYNTVHITFTSKPKKTIYSRCTSKQHLNVKRHETITPIVVS